MMTTLNTTPPTVDLTTLPVKRRRRTLQRVLFPVAVFLVVVVGGASFLRNDALQWDVARSYLFNDRILEGVWMTLRLTLLSMVFGLLLAGVIAAMRLSSIPIFRTLGAVYVWFFRAVPLLVLLIVMFNIGLLYPQITLGLPFLEPFIDVRTSEIVSGMMCAVLALTLYEGAYGSEVVRSSLLSVPKGQREAGVAIGMTSAKVFRRVVFPQGMRVATPLLANQVIQMTKNTSVVAFIAVPDLLYAAQNIYARSFEVIPLLLVVTIWYLVLVTVLTGVQSVLERRYGAQDRASRIASRATGMPRLFKKAS